MYRLGLSLCVCGQLLFCQTGYYCSGDAAVIAKDSVDSMHGLWVVIEQEDVTYTRSQLITDLRAQLGEQGNAAFREITMLCLVGSQQRAQANGHTEEIGSTTRKERGW